MSQTANENQTDATGNSSGAQSNNQNAGPQTMSLDDATIDRIAAASSRQAAQNVRDNGAQQNHQDNGAQSNNSSGGQNDLLTAIQALPEQITRSVKEALQPPAANTGAQNNNGQQDSGAQGNGSAQQESGAGSNEPGKRKSFGEWWFGS